MLVVEVVECGARHFDAQKASVVVGFSAAASAFTPLHFTPAR